MTAKYKAGPRGLPARSVLELGPRFFGGLWRDFLGTRGHGGACLLV